MAVGAAYNASLNFSHKFRQCATTSAKDRNLFEFPIDIDMIEVKDAYVCLATVNARVRPQVVEDEGSISNAMLVPGFTASRVVFFGVHNVMIATVKRHARLAVGCPSAVLTPRKAIALQITIALRAVPIKLFHVS